jgi:cytochrome c peroxidase
LLLRIVLIYILLIFGFGLARRIKNMMRGDQRASGGGGVLLAALLAGCAGRGGSAGPTEPAAPPLSVAATAGKALFFDKTLSVSGQQSCGTCHVPSRAYTADPATDHGLPVPLGGPAMDLPGFRSTPSLVYASFTPGFFLDDGTPTGGFFRDGRASSLATQAIDPFTTPFEMANQDAAEVITRLQSSPATLAAFEAAYGSEVLADPDAALADIGQAIAAFETEDPSFHPFSSKYDAFLAGEAQLTDQESRGLALFNSPGKGNCAACHPSHPQGYDSHALFTDFTYDTVGVPRNWAIPANAASPASPVDGTPLNYLPAMLNRPSDAEYAFYDLGLCGPFTPPPSDPHRRPDFANVTSLCGSFKVPTLRNVAITAPYFHNGVFPTLQQVVEFYVTRDISSSTGNNPTPVPAGPAGNSYAPTGSFYTDVSGAADLLLYNDLPADFDANVNIGEVPYTPPALAGGQSPTLTLDEINALVAFLCTLTDGYDPAHPGTYALQPQCLDAAAAAAATTPGRTAP